MDLSPKIKRATTLLVDDDQLIRDSMRLAFRNQACFIQVVESAEAALRILNKVSFDVIISDLELPGIHRGLDRPLLECHRGGWPGTTPGDAAITAGV